MIDNTKEYILCAAIKRKEPRDCQPYHPNTNDICNIELGYRHHDILHRFDGEMSECEQGFYTSKGRYVDRYEGMEIAFNAGQERSKDEKVNTMCTCNACYIRIVVCYMVVCSLGIKSKILRNIFKSVLLFSVNRSLFLCKYGSSSTR